MQLQLQPHITSYGVYIIIPISMAVQGRSGQCGRQEGGVVGVGGRGNRGSDVGRKSRQRATVKVANEKGRRRVAVAKHLKENRREDETWPANAEKVLTLSSNGRLHLLVL